MPDREKLLEAALRGMLAAVVWDEVRDRPTIHLAYDGAEAIAARKALGRNADLEWLKTHTT